MFRRQNSLELIDPDRQMPPRQSGKALDRAQQISHIRSISCSGPNSSHYKASASKPKTKCSFTQLQLIKQDDSNCGSANEHISINNTVTYSSNPSVTKPSQANISANKQKYSVNQVCNYGRMTTSSGQAFNPPQRIETQVSAGFNRKSGKEILSSLGQTPSTSQFDLENGLPSCLRNEQPFKLGHRRGTSGATAAEKEDTSFNDIKQALLNGNPEDDLDRDNSSQGMVGPYSLQTIQNVLNTESNVSDSKDISANRISIQKLNDCQRERYSIDQIMEDEQTNTLKIIQEEYNSKILEAESPKVRDFAMHQ